jgi:hypothetical protein
MTKIKTRGHGGARAGAGRKSGSEKTANFSTRIPIEVREALDAEARRQGRSLAAVAQEMLERGLEVKQKGERTDAHMRGFLFLIERIGAMVGHGHGCLTNPFKHKSFRIAVDRLFEWTKPDGEFVSPLKDADPALVTDQFRKMWSSPESRAEVVMDGLWVLLQTVSEQESNDLGLDSLRHLFANAARDVVKIKPGGE